MKTEATKRLEILQKERSKTTASNFRVFDTINLKISTPGSFEKFTLDDLLEATKESSSEEEYNYETFTK